MLLDHASSSVAEARHRMARELDRLHVRRPAIEDAVLVLSELVSNAIKHARPLRSGKVVVKWKITDGEEEKVWIGVTDGGSDMRPVPGRPSPSAVGGRGLGIVSLVNRRRRWSTGPTAATP